MTKLDVDSKFELLTLEERASFHKFYDTAMTASTEVDDEAIVLMTRMKPLFKLFFYQGAYARQQLWEK